MSSVTASKSEKNASTESAEPIKQAIIIIEHKIRNLEKRKRKIESYREEQKNGKELNADQLNAVAKFDEVQLTLEFARDLCKQFNGIALDAVKQQKKQARKEAQERTLQEISKVREILLVQDILYNLGAGESVRDDFIEGRNGAVMVSEDELNCLIEMSLAILPKRHKGDGLPTFPDQIQASAEHLIALTDGKSKDVVGTTYSKLKELILSINACGYFDEHVEEESIESAEENTPLKIASENSISSQQESAENPKVVIVKSQTIIPQDSPFNRSPLQANISTQSGIHQINPSTVLSSAVLPTTQPPPSSAVPAPLIVQPSHMHHIPQSVHTVENTFFSSASPSFVQPALAQSRPLNEVIRSVSGHFNFLQDSELDSPDLSTILSGAQGHSAAHVISAPASTNSTAVHPIPSQTFTNQNFVNVTGVTSPNVQHKVVFPSPEISHHIPGFATAASNASQISLPSNHQVPTVNPRPVSIQQISAITQQASPNATLAQHRVPVPQVVNYVAAAAAIASQTFAAQVHQLPQALPLKTQPLQLSQQPQQPQIQLPQTIQHTLQPQPSQLAQHPLPQQMHPLQQPQQPTQPAQQLQPLQQLQGSPQPQQTPQPLQNTVQQQIHQRLPNVQSLPVLSQPVSSQVPVPSVPAQPSSSQTVLVHTTSAQALPVQTQPLPAGFPSQKSAPDPPVETEKVAEPAASPPLDDKIDDWGSCDISQGDWSQQTELNTCDWSQQVAAEEWGECTTTTVNGFPTDEHVRSSSNNGRGPRGGRGSNGYSGRGRRNYQNGRGGGYGYRNDFKNNFNQNSGDQRDNFNGGYKRGGRGRGGNARGSERGGGNSRGGGERGGSRLGVGRVGSNNNSRGNRSGNFPRSGNNKQP